MKVSNTSPMRSGGIVRQVADGGRLRQGLFPQTGGARLKWQTPGVDNELEGLQMARLLTWAGRLAGSLGVILCAVAVLTRLGGTWSVANVAIGTLLQLGIASMVLGCLAYCAVLAESRGT
jgi:hypothetical protein